MEPRLQKQLIVGLVFILIFILVGYGAYVWIRIEPTCFDNVKNGKEEGVDCGLVACGKTCEPAIAPLEVISKDYVASPVGDYDFVAKIRNPNVLYGAVSFSYNLSFLGQDKTQLAKKTGSSYILPGQTKYVVISSIGGINGWTEASFEINSVQWSKVQSFDTAVNFMIRRQVFSSGQNGNSELEAVVFNDSDFDFDKVDVAIVIFDEAGGIIGAAKTDIRTFLAGTERGFKVQWPYSVDSRAAKTDTEAATNLFENQNFLRKYGTPSGRFL